MLANALLMAWFGFKLQTGAPGLVFLAIGYTALNALLSVLDQFGLVDLLVLVLDLVLLGMLLVTWRRLLLQASHSP
jgi:hypothetical protein